MSMLRFAFNDQAVVDQFSSEDQIKFDPNSLESKQAAAQFGRTVKQAKSQMKVSDDFIYVRTRAIGAMEKWGPNQNGDAFPLKELQASYQSFIGKGNFIDHKSDDIQKIRGIVVDAFMNNEDNCVECLIAVDKTSHPQLARDIETGVVNSVSMGTRVGWSTCSVCANVARTEDDYCSHIRSYKGMKFNPLIQNAAHKFGSWAVHEVNHELEFIELSWVSVPAFKEANVLEKLASLKKNIKTADDVSDAEREMINFAEARKPQASNAIPEAMQDIHDAAQCRDTECAYDPRKANNRKGKEVTAMERIKITKKSTTYRDLTDDFTASGTVAVDGKDFTWNASGDKDRTDWDVDLPLDDLSDFSKAGKAKIKAAIKEMLSKNVKETDLIVGSYKPNTKTAYIHGQYEDEGMTQTLEERLARPEKIGDKPVYDPNDLNIMGTGKKTTRDLEQAAFEGSAKEGPAGAIVKNSGAGKGTDNTSKDELKYKETLHRAQIEKSYITYKLGRK